MVLASNMWTKGRAAISEGGHLDSPSYHCSLCDGFADGAANDYVEMFKTLDTGLLFEDIQKTKPKIEGTSIK
jgi:hypothetical protein